MKKVEVRAPALGESVTGGLLASWSVKDGSTVIEGQALCEFETDKTTIDITAPATGTLSIVVSEGTDVAINQVLGAIVTDERGNHREKSDAEAKEVSEAGEESAIHSVRRSPSARAEAARSGVDTGRISGSGRDNLINKSDVIAARSGTPDAHDEPAGQGHQNENSHFQIAVEASKTPPRGQTKEMENYASAGTGEHREPLSRIRKIIAANLAKTQAELVLLTTFNEADMSAIKDIRERYKEAFQEKHGVKLGFMSFFLKASAAALGSFPELNAYIDGDEVVYRGSINISVAVSTPRGLVTPVVRDVQSKKFREIEREIASFSARAANKTLLPDDLMGGGFTISNGGVFGSLLSTPLPAPGQTAILGMHSIVDRPVAIDNTVQIRPMMYLALSYDHRLIDGKEAVGFLREIKEGIENPERLLLEV